MRRLILAAVAVLWLSGCTGIPSGTEAVTDLELERYLGTWYEIARLDHSFERDLDCVTAHYSLRDDGGVRVINRGFNIEEQTWNETEGRAYFLDAPDVGRLKVSFFGPFYGGYNILELDENYRWALVAGPNRGYLWILARSPSLDDKRLEWLTQRAAEMDFAIDELIHVRHANGCPEADAFPIRG